MRRSATALALVCLGLFAGPSPAQRAGESPELERNRLRWQAMSESERAVVRARHVQWKALSEPEREAMRKNHQRFTRLDPNDQRELALVHRRALADAPTERRTTLTARLARLDRLSESERKRAMAVGLFLHEAGPDVTTRMAALPPPARTRALAGLREVYDELPSELRTKLDELPPWRRHLVIQHILEERRSRFAQLFQTTIDLPEERFIVGRLLAQLDPAERAVFAEIAPRHKARLMPQLLRTPPDQQLKALRKMIKNHQQRGEGKGSEGKPPRDD